MALNDGKIKDSFTGNTDRQLPPASLINRVVLGNRTNKVVTGFQIGSTPGGSEIVGPVDIGVAGTDAAIVIFTESQVKKRFFDFFEEKTLYFSAANWNGAVIGGTVFFDDVK